jgi:hypothetical protein
LNADSIGYWGSSEEISTRAISSRFNHSSDVPGGFGSVALIICFRILRVSHETALILNAQKTEQETENSKPETGDAGTFEGQAEQQKIDALGRIFSDCLLS